MINWREILTYLCFVVLATAIWYGRALRSVHDKTLSVEVHYTGIPGSVSFDDPLPDKLNIQVRDAGTRLRSYSDTPLSISVDLTGLFESASGEINIASETLKTAVKQQLQGTTSLQKISPQTIHATYRTQVQKRVPIILRHRIECAPEYQLVDTPTLLQSSVMAYGTTQALDSLEEISTKMLSLSEVKDTNMVSIGLVAPQGIRLSQQSIQVRVIAERYSEKVMTLPVTIEGVPQASRVRIFPNQVSVSMHIGLSHWNEVSEKDIHPYCVYSDSLETLPVKVRSDNPYVTGLRVHPNSVEYLVEHD